MPLSRPRALSAILAHPWTWVLLALPLLVAWSGTVYGVRWNLMEMMIGRNLLAGRGPVVAVLDPPALWRPPLGWMMCAAVETVVRDPFRVFQVLYTLSVAGALVGLFHAARRAWGLAAAHAACLFLLTSGAVTALLVDHPHGLSHVVLLGVAAPAIAFTLAALERPEPRWPWLAGAGWALAWYARPEAASAFVVTALFLLHSAWRARRLAPVLSFVAAFLLAAAPYLLYAQHARARHGITGASALTTFYASEAWVNGGGDEDAGFARAVARFGPVVEHGDSLARFLWRRPDAARERLAANLPALAALYAGGALFHPAWWLALPFALFDARRPGRRRASLYCLGLLLASSSVALFHADARYATLGVLPLALILSGGIAAAWEVARGTASPVARRTAAAGLAALGVLVAASSLGDLAARVRSGRYGQARAGIRAARLLAEDFRARPRRSPAVLAVVAESASAMALETPSQLVSYFAGTGLSWARPGPYPRGEIFSMVHKRAGYAYLPESMLRRTDVLAHRRALSAVEVSARERYYLFDAEGLPPLRPLSRLDAGTLDRIRAVLVEEHPRLVAGFDAERTWSEVRVHLRSAGGAADRVGCGPRALAPDGRRDRALAVAVSESIPATVPRVVDAIVLERTRPFGVWETGGAHFVLGVAAGGGDVLLNRADGGVKIALEPGLRLRLLACDDGAGTPASEYRVHLHLGAVTLTSPAVALP